jgi:hypothetical protein
MSGDALSEIYNKERNKYLLKGDEAFDAWKQSLVEELATEEIRVGREAVVGPRRVSVMKSMSTDFGQRVCPF